MTTKPVYILNISSIAQMIALAIPRMNALGIGHYLEIIVILTMSPDEGIDEDDLIQFYYEYSLNEDEIEYLETKVYRELYTLLHSSLFPFLGENLLNGCYITVKESHNYYQLFVEVK